MLTILINPRDGEDGRKRKAWTILMVIFAAFTALILTGNIFAHAAYTQPVVTNLMCVSGTHAHGELKVTNEDYHHVLHFAAGAEIYSHVGGPYFIVILDQEVNLPAHKLTDKSDPSVVVRAHAKEVGSAYNVAIGAINDHGHAEQPWKATNITPFTGGTDPHTCH